MNAENLNSSARSGGFHVRFHADFHTRLARYVMANTTSLLAAPAGGLLLAGAIALVTALTGRSMGVSGMAAAVLRRDRDERRVSVAFLAGMIACGALLGVAAQDFAIDTTARPALAFVLGGALIGWGARRANGCTSGHGIAGISRGSARSIVALALFGLSASLVVAVWPGGAS
jgi:uncharacterized protein